MNARRELLDAIDGPRCFRPRPAGIAAAAAGGGARAVLRTSEQIPVLRRRATSRRRRYPQHSPTWCRCCSRTPSTSPTRRPSSRPAAGTGCCNGCRRFRCAVPRTWTWSGVVEPTTGSRGLEAAGHTHPGPPAGRAARSPSSTTRRRITRGSCGTCAPAQGWRTKPNNDRPFFSLGPSSGPSSVIEAARIGAALWAPPGDALSLPTSRCASRRSRAGAALRNRWAKVLAAPARSPPSRPGRRRSRSAWRRRCAPSPTASSRRHEPMVLTGLWFAAPGTCERGARAGCCGRRLPPA